MVEMLKGIAASDGVAVAKAYLLVQPDLSFSKVNVEDTAAEEARLDEALAKSTAELQQIRDKAAQSLGEAEAQVWMTMHTCKNVQRTSKTLRNVSWHIC